MLISTNIINSEITRAKNIRYNLIKLFVDATLVGNANMIYRYSKDICALHLLEKSLEYSTKQERDSDFVMTTISKIHDYINALNISSTIDYFSRKYFSEVCNKVPDNVPNMSEPSETTPTTPTYVISSDGEWYTVILSVSSDGQETIENLPFDISDITDIDTLVLNIEGDNPIYTTTVTTNGYHIVGDTLYWHGFYDLKTDMTIELKWKV